jgi:hypothetical protein
LISIDAGVLLADDAADAAGSIDIVVVSSKAMADDLNLLVLVLVDATKDDDDDS